MEYNQLLSNKESVICVAFEDQLSEGVLPLSRVFPSIVK